MALEQALLTWIHITSAAIWVGGSLFIGVVFAPILKKMSMPVEERIRLMVQVGRRFNKLASTCFVYFNCNRNVSGTSSITKI